MFLRHTRFVPLLLALLLASCKERRPATNTGPETIPVTIADQTFNLELALDPPARFQGLSDRPVIAPDGGMLFVFPDVTDRQFVMRRCPAPIDLIYLGAGGRIVSMHRMKVEPPETPEGRLKRYDSGWPAQFAIELAGGTLDKLSLNTGDRIHLPYDSLKQRAR